MPLIKPAQLHLPAGKNDAKLSSSDGLVTDSQALNFFKKIVSGVQEQKNRQAKEVIANTYTPKPK